ncbi:MAG: helix-turn-helix transcriptional regulator [Planctomycetota bacterium]
MRLVSHLSRAIRKLGLSNAQFADQAGVARSTVQKLIAQDFKEIRVDTLERLAARLGTGDVSELFSLMDDSEDFLEPFRASKSVTFLFGTHDVTDAPVGAAKGAYRELILRTTVDMWDFRAKALLLNHIRRHVPEVRDRMEFFSIPAFGAEDRSHLLDLFGRENVVIIGSPKVNPACELALRELYPGCRKDPTLLEKGPPLRLADPGRLRESVLGLAGRSGLGIVDVASGQMVAESVYRGAGQTSLDAGLLLIVFRPRLTNENVLLTIAAGITGCGTYGVIQGLLNHPPTRDELVSGEPRVRAFQTRYAKPTESSRDDRKVLEVLPASAER